MERVSLPPNADEEVLNWLMENADALYLEAGQSGDLKAAAVGPLPAAGSLFGTFSEEFLLDDPLLGQPVSQPVPPPAAKPSKRKRRGTSAASAASRAAAAAPSGRSRSAAAKGTGRKAKASSSGKVAELQERLIALEDQNLQMRLELKIGPHGALKQEEQASLLHHIEALHL